MAGTRDTSIRSYHLYMEGLTPNTGVFTDAEIDFVDMIDQTPFLSQGLIIANDNAAAGADILFSFDGTTVHGRAKAGDIITFDFRRERVIYLKSSAASAFRFWAW